MKDLVEKYNNIVYKINKCIDEDFCKTNMLFNELKEVQKMIFKNILKQNELVKFIINQIKEYGCIQKNEFKNKLGIVFINKIWEDEFINELERKVKILWLSH